MQGKYLQKMQKIYVNKWGSYKHNLFGWGMQCKRFNKEKLKEVFIKYTEEIYKKIGIDIVKRTLIKRKLEKKKSKCQFLFRRIYVY